MTVPTYYHRSETGLIIQTQIQTRTAAREKINPGAFLCPSAEPDFISAVKEAVVFLSFGAEDLWGRLERYPRSSVRWSLW